MAFWDRGKITVNNVLIRNIDNSDNPIDVQNAVGTSQFKVTPAGNMTVGGTSTLTGAQTLTGAATLSGTVALNGNTTLATAKTLTITDDGAGLISGATVIAATGVEINRAADVSTRLIAGGASLTLTIAAHDGKTILMDTAAGTTITLPASSGSGARFRFQISVTATSNSHIIKVANASDIIQGVVFALGDDAASLQGWEASGTADTITFNRSTTGTAAVGHFIEIEDVKTNVFAVHGFIAQTGTEATPFSATV